MDILSSVETAFGISDALAAEASMYQSTYITSNEPDYNFIYDYDPCDPCCEVPYYEAGQEYYEALFGPDSRDAGTSAPVSWTYDDEGKDVKVSFNASQRDVWRNAKRELKCICINCKEKMGIEAQEAVKPVSDSLRLFFGRQRALGDLLSLTLGKSRGKTLQFLATYAFQKQHGKSIPNIYKEGSGFDRTILSKLMPEDEYEACWRILDTAGTTSNIHRRGEIPFWEKFMNWLNETFVELYVCHDWWMLIALDDDKRNAELKKDQDLQDLKSAVHDVKKRAGVVGHMAVSVYSMLTLCVIWEKEDDTPYSCYMQAVRNIFGSRRLDQVIFGSDRGYWIPRLAEKLIELGADIERT